MGAGRDFLEERRFGFLVGTLLIVLGGVLELLKHRRTAFLVFAGIGAFLVFLSFVAPGALVGLRSHWMRLAHVLGRVNTAILLFLLFYLVLTPLGFVLRLFGRDELLRRRAPADSMWVPYPERNRDPTHFEKIF